MNFNAKETAQATNYAERAMNAFQTAVNIDNQQSQPEQTTFSFRWFQIITIVTSMLAIICGVIGAFSISPSCLAAGVITSVLGFAMIMFEVPIVCQFVSFTQPIGEFWKNRKPWQKAFVYLLPPFLPFVLCQSISILLGVFCLLINGVIQTCVQCMLAVGNK